MCTVKGKLGDADAFEWVSLHLPGMAASHTPFLEWHLVSAAQVLENGANAPGHPSAQQEMPSKNADVVKHLSMNQDQCTQLKPR